MFRAAYWLLTFSCLIIAGYYYWDYQCEQLWLASFAAKIVEDCSATTQHEKSKALRDYIRKNVRHEGLSQENRPFLRDSARTTLERGKGYCGEATRAYINLAAHVGLKAKRVNLHGRLHHVVPEVEILPGTWILVDVQENREVNDYLDNSPKTLDIVVNDPGSPFYDYSNLNLRRVPGISSLVQRVKLQESWLTWILENPSLLKALLFALAGLGLIGLRTLDRLLLRIYAFRLGVKIPRKATHASHRQSNSENTFVDTVSTVPP